MSQNLSVNSKSGIKSIVWLFGPSATGKTTFLERVRAQRVYNLNTILLLRDLEIILQLLNADTKEQYHKKLPAKHYRITSNYIYEESLRRLCRIAIDNIRRYKLMIIEISCGCSSHQSIDFSIPSRLRIIPDVLKRQSEFLYISTPFHKRLEYNCQREQKLRIPAHVFTDYYQQDHFEKLSPKSARMFYIMSNQHGLDKYYQSIDQWLYTKMGVIHE